MTGQSADSLQNRVETLENLVLHFMQQSGDSNAEGHKALSVTTSDGEQQFTPSTSEGVSQPDGESDTDGVANTLGTLVMQNNKIRYLSGAHWASILSTVRITMMAGSKLSR